MKLFATQNGLVLAWHPDDSDVDPARYGPGVEMIEWRGTLDGLDRFGPPPAPGAADDRPFKAPVLSLEERKAAILGQVDARAEAERQRWITPGAGQAMTYQRKVEEAYRLEADAEPIADSYPMLAASVGIDGDTLTTVGAVVLQQDAAWTQIGAAIEARRLGLKRDVGAAANLDVLVAIDIATGWPEVVP